MTGATPFGEQGVPRPGAGGPPSGEFPQVGRRTGGAHRSGEMPRVPPDAYRSGEFPRIRPEAPPSGELPRVRPDAPRSGEMPRIRPDAPRSGEMPRVRPGAAPDAPNSGALPRIRRDTPLPPQGRRRGEGPPPPGSLRDAVRRDRAGLPPPQRIAPKKGRAAAPLWPGMLTPGPSPAAQPAPPKPRVRRSLVVGLVAVAGSLATAAVVLTYTAAATNPRQPVAAITDPILGGGPGCEPTRENGLVRGNGLGSTDTGPEAVLAFQHAYYVTRSGTAARAVTTPDAAVSSVEVIDAGIASVPPNTQHCVLITQMADGRFDVVITESRPDGAVRTYRQFVTVTVWEGRVVIAAIARPS